MTPEQVKSTIHEYKLRLAKEISPGGADEINVLEWKTARTKSLAHIAAMLDRIDILIEKEQTEKYFRWLGFIQGVLWVCGIYSIYELKDDNRSK